MRLTTFILMISLLQVSASTLGQRFTMQKKNASLNEVFTEIRKQTGYFVIYADDKIDASAKLDINFKQTDLKDVLSFIGKSKELQYTIDDKNISFKPKDPTFLDRVVATLTGVDVTGRVVDSENRPLPGATVKVKTTGKGVSTDGKGNFYLKNVEEGTVLVISYTGYISKEVKADKDMGDIALELSLSKLDEVQVIAYGTTTQRLSTGNVTTIKADVIEKQPVNNPLLALQGRVPGLFIEQATGFAGTGVKVRIQGRNSLNNGNDPLYVVNGIPFTSQLLSGAIDIVGNSGAIGSDGNFISGNPMDFINPSDIESIDVLKDADATAIYGSRAANGAILITTKKGKSGDTRVNLNLQSGWGKVPSKLKLMNSKQYLEMRREALKNDGIITVDPGSNGDNDLNGNWDNKRNIDWQKELIGGTALYQDLNASINGGSERTTFLLGARHHRETTVFPLNFSDNKSSITFNINNTSISQKFRVEFSGSYLIDNNQLPGADLTPFAMSLAPVAPSLFTSDGNVNWAPNSAGASTFAANPIGYLSNRSINKTSNLMSNMILSYQVMPNLQLKSLFGYTKLNSSIMYKMPLYFIQPEIAKYLSRTTIFTNNEINSWSIEPQLSSHHNISQGKLEVLAGATFLKNTKLGSGFIARGFSNDLVMEDILSATSIASNSSINSTYKYNAIFGRINYNWQDKYILNINIRRDGSSRFGSENQFHNFWSVGGAWIFSNEQLIKKHFGLLSFGKFKASYGTTGNDQLSDYRYLSLYDPIQQDISYQGIVAYQPNRLSNPYLEWEETRKLQFGLDLGFLKDRILINCIYYNNHSSNQLGTYVLPSTTGFTYIAKNLDDNIENSGWESTITSLNVKSKDFKWSSSVNFTLPKTLLKGSNDNRFPLTSKVGAPLSAEYVYHFAGVDPATGLYQFEDRNGNLTSSPDDQLDRTVLVDLAPKFYGGIQNSFSYKGFQLDFLFSFTKQKGVNQVFGVSGAAAGNNNGGSTNELVSLLDRWQKPRDISTIQRFTTNSSDVYKSLQIAKQSNAAWSDASYMRLENVSVSWQFPKKWCSSTHLKNFVLFTQGQNLWTLTNYKGLDPETKNSASLPPLRVITIGLKVAF